jgi:hypothetical protein
MLRHTGSHLTPAPIELDPAKSPKINDPAAEQPDAAQPSQSSSPAPSQADGGTRD